MSYEYIQNKFCAYTFLRCRPLCDLTYHPTSACTQCVRWSAGRARAGRKCTSANFPLVYSYPKLLLPVPDAAVSLSFRPCPRSSPCRTAMTSRQCPSTTRSMSARASRRSACAVSSSRSPRVAAVSVMARTTPRQRRASQTTASTPLNPSPRSLF